MPERQANKLIVWVAVITLLVSVVASAITTGVFAGNLGARVGSLEKATGNEITREEWNTFKQDLFDRLDRIERRQENGK